MPKYMMTKDGKVIKEGVFKSLIFIFILLLSGCQSTSTAPETTYVPNREITLNDASEILDIASGLPISFKLLNASDEGMAKADLGLGSDYSEVQLYMREEPFQVVYGFYGIEKNRIVQAASNAFMKDEKQVIAVIQEGIDESARIEGVVISDYNTNVTYPNIGELCVLGEGSVTMEGMYIGFDFIEFKRGNIYVCVASVYMAEDKQSLIPLANIIDNNIYYFK